ncbi:hypothetical protein AgCh_038046 [Apium graveolens]
MDVKTAFLNGELEEEVYMTQPKGFLFKGNEHLLCKLLRTIYGLRQVSRRWNIRFDETIKEFGFIKNIDEPCVYKKVSGSADLGEASYILGMKIYRDRSRRMISLTQGTYIQKVLKRFSMENSKRGLIPMIHGVSLSEKMSPKTPEERERMSKIPYASTIGSIMIQASNAEENEEGQRLALDLIDEVRDEAHAKIVEYHKKASFYYNLRVKERFFKQGDLVLRKVEASGFGQKRKLAPN